QRRDRTLGAIPAHASRCGPMRSSCAPPTLRVGGAAQRHQCFSVEAAAKKDETVLLFTLKEMQRSLELAARTLSIARTADEQSQMQPRHREARIERGRGAVKIDRVFGSTGVLAAEGDNVVSTGVAVVTSENAARDRLGGREFAALRQQHRL